MKKKDSMSLYLKNDYMKKLNQIDSRKRIILLDWIMEVCCLFNFKRETYHSTVVLIDTFLSQINDLQIKDYQLVGVTCLLICAKNEEIVVPSVHNFAETTKFTYMSNDILNFENKSLGTDEISLADDIGSKIFLAPASKHTCSVLANSSTFPIVPPILILPNITKLPCIGLFYINNLISIYLLFQDMKEYLFELHHLILKEMDLMN